MGCSLHNRFIDNDTTMKNQLKKFTCVSFQENDLMIKLNKSITFNGYKLRGSFIMQFILIDIHRHALHRYQHFKQTRIQITVVDTNPIMNYSLIDLIINKEPHKSDLKNITFRIQKQSQIDIYTDDLLINLKKLTYRIGIGWFIANI